MPERERERERERESENLSRTMSGLTMGSVPTCESTKWAAAVAAGDDDDKTRFCFILKVNKKYLKYRLAPKDSSA